MKAVPPETGREVVYRWTSERGNKTETYTVHCEKLMVKGAPAFQSISVYPDRVRRVTMRASDLTPIAMSERWKDGERLIARIYLGEGKVRCIRRGKGMEYPMDETVEIPPGTHDPESFAFLLKGYPFARQDTVAPINVLLADPNPLFSRPRSVAVVIVPKGEEPIKAPAGEFNCYKLEMRLAGLLGYLLPKNSFWLLKDDPHLIVKAEGGGETVELLRGARPCDGVRHCRVRAQAPEWLR